jgi:multimeric flavodoxin WrbA
MTKIAIVYFSGYGHTAKQAAAVQRGAASIDGVEVTVLRIDQEGNLPNGWTDVLASQDAVIYGSPTYMGGPAWQFKKFADASSKLWTSKVSKTSSRPAYQLSLCQWRQILDHPVPVDAVPAAWPIVGRHRPPGGEYEGQRTE